MNSFDGIKAASDYAVDVVVQQHGSQIPFPRIVKLHSNSNSIFSTKGFTTDVVVQWLLSEDPFPCHVEKRGRKRTCGGWGDQTRLRGLFGQYGAIINFPSIAVGAGLTCETLARGFYSNLVHAKKISYWNVPRHTNSILNPIIAKVHQKIPCCRKNLMTTNGFVNLGNTIHLPQHYVAQL